MDARERKKTSDRIRNSAAFRVVLGLVDDGKKMQEAQAEGLEGELFPPMEKFEPFGFTSNPPSGSEALAFPVGGDRGHLVILAAGDRASRKKGLAPGEAAVYTGEGDYLHFKNGNKLEVLTKESVFDSQTKAEFKSPQIHLMGPVSAEGYVGGATTFVFTGDMTINGNLAVTGNITAAGSVSAGEDVTAGGISLKNHTHQGDSGGSTGRPR